MCVPIVRSLARCSVASRVDPNPILNPDPNSGYVYKVLAGLQTRFREYLGDTHVWHAGRTGTWLVLFALGGDILAGFKADLNIICTAVCRQSRRHSQTGASVHGTQGDFPPEKP